MFAWCVGENCISGVWRDLCYENGVWENKAGVGFPFTSSEWIKRDNTYWSSNTFLLSISIQLQKPELEKHTAPGKKVGVWDRKRRNMCFCFIFHIIYINFGYCMKPCAYKGEVNSSLTGQSCVIELTILLFSLLLPTIPQVCRKKLSSNLYWQLVAQHVKDL